MLSKAPCNENPDTYLLVSHDFCSVAIFEDERLRAFSERHKCKLPPPLRAVGSDVVREVERNGVTGVVFELNRGWANRGILRVARALRGKVRVFFYWPGEEALEVIDRAAYLRHFKLFAYVTVYRKLRGELPEFRDPNDIEQPLPVDIVRQASDAEFGKTIEQRLDDLTTRALPIAMPAMAPIGTLPRVQGWGVYLRTDYWANIRAGGSFGHTCYVAKALADRAANFVCFMASQFDMLTDMGLHQVAIDQTGARPAVEREMLATSDIHYGRLKTAFEVIRPAYIYERLVPGNFCGVRLSQDLGIPYIVEFNGSETMMMRSFNGRPYQFEDLFIKAEVAAFKQATAISVISDAVKDQVVRLGIDPAKVLVNPNGVDATDYRPADPEAKKMIRQQWGWDDSHVVVGFVGTFGGWHGIEVLAAALPKICAQAPNIRFLLVGGGNLHSLVVQAVEDHGLGDRVVLTGMVPQRDAQTLMRACDVLVSPHDTHMKGSRFFGSPTKIFEYMALGGAIVASRLEQIGEVLSPALRPDDLEREDVAVTAERAVLCEPGNLDEFVHAVVGLSRRSDICGQLGANARKAAIEHYSWDKHVDKILDFAHGLSADFQTFPADLSAQPRSLQDAPLQTGDAYKDEVQKQWDNDPCGSHYVGDVESRQEFFAEAERFRHTVYAPWMPKVMEFARHRGEKVLEIGGGMGTDLAQFASNGAIVTDVDLSSGHLRHAQENFSLRGLSGEFIHADGETIPLPDNSFDVVYSNGVIHHTPNTRVVVNEIFRLLKPGGKAIIMVYRENSLVFWRDLVLWRGCMQGQLNKWSIHEIMSRSVEISETGARPLVKVYTPSALRDMFKDFDQISICRRQLMPQEMPKWLRWIPMTLLERFLGWNLIIKAIKAP